MMVTLLTSFFAMPQQAEAATPRKNDCGRTIDAHVETTFDTGSELIQRYNKHGFELNWDLYRVFGIQSYGNYSQVPSNLFALAYEDGPESPIEEGIGRFYNSGCGEWKYYGYDVDGNLYYNIHFPSKKSTTGPETKKWIESPWETLPQWYGAKPTSGGAIYNGANPMEERFSDLGLYLREQIGFAINTGITPYDDGRAPLAAWEKEDRVGDDADPRLFAVVEKEPSLLIPGTATMFHKNQAAQTGIFMYSFPLAAMQHSTMKQIPPVTADLDYSPQPVPLKNYKGQTHAKVSEVIGSAVLEDSDMTTNMDKMFWYTRRDIKEWHIEISSSDFTLEETLKPNENMAASRHLDVLVPIDKIVFPADSATGTYRVNVKATVVFLDGKTQFGTTSKDIVFNRDGYVDYMTEFVITPEVTFSKRSQFASKLLEYADTTPKDQAPFDAYRITIEEPISGLVRTHETTRSNFVPSVAQSVMYLFIRDFFPDETVQDKREMEFWVHQDIIKSGKVVASAVSKPVRVIQWGADGPEETKRPDPLNPGGYVSFKHEVLEYLTPDVTIPGRWYDVVGFPAQDRTEGWATRSVWVDGVAVDADQFFSGQWVSGIGTHGLRHVYMEWTSPLGITSSAGRWTVIYDTKPRIQIKWGGIQKENRKVTATNDSAVANDPFVTDAYPLTYEFEFLSGYGGDDDSLRIKTDTDLHKEFLYKKPGKYAISLRASNSLGRVSDPYIVEYEILPDEKPAVILHPFDGQVARGEDVRLQYEAFSVDDDHIAHQWVKLWHDGDNNGTYETLVQTWTNTPLENITPPTGKIGKYMLEGYAKESTTQETIPEFVTDDDWKTETVTAYFEVGNYQPMADLYIDKPIERAPVDVYFLLDRAMSQTRINYMNANEITNTNKLISINVDPRVDTWDMKTYTYSTSGSTSSHTGTTYPSSSTYYCSGGYCGTLTLSSVSNSPWSKDEGEWKERNVADYEHRSFTGSCSNYRTREEIKDPVTGKVTYGPWSSSMSECPSEYSINEDGFRGIIPRTGETLRSSSNTHEDWEAHYSGTLTKTIVRKEQYWVPNWVDYDDYTGYYSGTIYKDVRQPYDNSFMRVISTKYVVYMSDGNISQLSDLQNAVTKNGAKLICIGATTMQSQITCDHFIRNDGKETDKLVDDAVNIIKQLHPPKYRAIFLVNEPITTKIATADIESDPIIKDEFKKWQDMSFFEIPDGFENSEGPSPGVSTNRDAASWGAYQKTVTFAKPGLYHLIRRVQDRPTTDSRFAEYNFYSSESDVEVIVHRKPIADVILDWDYDPSQNNYKTIWVDQSYDLDHQYNHPTRGIVDRVLSLRHHSTGDIWHAIPERLYHGTYTLTYAVKDVEGAWSDTITKTFTLQATPPMQFEAKARTELNTFTMSSIPASEQLRAYDQWTRYPYNVSLQYGLYQGGNLRTPQTTKSFTPSNGIKTGNDIRWTDTIYSIPATTPDGQYIFRVTAAGQLNSAYKEFPVTVNTPIEPRGQLDSQWPLVHPNVNLLVVGDKYTIRGTTTKYAETMSVTLFKGTPYAKSFTLQQGSTTGTSRSWSYAGYTLPSLPNGNYTVEWTARTPSGKTESYSRIYQVINNRPPVAAFDWSPKPVWEGDTVTLTNQSHDPDNDPLQFDWTITAPNGTVTRSNERHVQAKFDQIGNYIVTLTAFDGRLSDSITRTIQANELTITPSVHHTQAWLEHHTDKGHETVHDPKDFYAGEIFIVQAISSPTAVNSVRAWLTTKGIDGTDLHTEAQLLPSATAHIYSAELFDLRWVSLTEGLSKGDYTIQFEIQYANGVIKQATVPIRIIGNAQSTTGIHRLR